MEIERKKMEAVRLIHQKDYTSAAAMLKDILAQNPDDRIANYYTGLLCVYELNYEMAEDFFEKAKSLGMDDCALWMNLSGVYEDLGKMAEAEEGYKDAVKRAADEQERWSCITALGLFYLKRKQYLRARKIAAQLQKDFPANYEGWHLQYEIARVQEQYEECQRVLKLAEESFGDHPVCLGDQLELWKETKSPEEILELLEADQRFMEKIPLLTLRTRVMLLERLNRREEAKKDILILAERYLDPDAMISAVLFAFGDQDYRRVQQLCLAVMKELENDPEDIHYFHATYYSMFASYMEDEGQIRAENIKWVEQGVDYCEKWLMLHQIEDAKMRETLDLIKNAINIH